MTRCNGQIVIDKPVVLIIRSHILIPEFSRRAVAERSHIRAIVYIRRCFLYFGQRCHELGLVLLQPVFVVVSTVQLAISAVRSAINTGRTLVCFEFLVCRLKQR